MDFQQFKLQLVQATDLERDALHIYIGLGVFLLSLLLTRPVFKQLTTRLNIALIMATLVACLGEYLDMSRFYPNLSTIHYDASIHDIINTCFWPYVLYALSRWTSIFKDRT